VTDPEPPPTKTWRYYWEDFPVGHRSEFGAMTVSREAVIAFASDFDPQPFHIDEDAARQSLFGGLCASGWHTCAMAMRMMCDEYLLEAASLGSPGLDNLRWLKPVFPGDVLSMRHEVTEARGMATRAGVGLVRSRWEVLNQHGQTVMTMEGWGMYRRRHPSPAGAGDAGAAPGPAT